LIVHLRGLERRRVWLGLLGAALLGLGVNLRETAGLYFPWLVIAPFVAGWKPDRRTMAMVIGSAVIFCCLAFGIFAIWFTSDAIYRANWRIWLESTRNESSRHPISFSNLKPFFVYFFLAAPLVFLALPRAFIKEWRAQGRAPPLRAGAAGLLWEASR